MATLNKENLFPPEVVKDIYSLVRGKSTLAKLSAQTPIPFNGIEQFTFNLNGNAQIVGEGEQKKAGEAVVTSKVIKPVKIVYQFRVSDEFMRASAEKQLNFLRPFKEGMAMKIAEAFDIAAIHGLEPKSMTDASFKATNSFDGLVTANVVAYDAAKIDANLEDAMALVTDEFPVNGIALSPTAGSAMGKIANSVNGLRMYPEFRFGQIPSSFVGMGLDINRTLTMVGGTAKTDHAIVGDFNGNFTWGYADNIPFEVIEYGDPDGIGRDLKAFNEICLRAEAFIGWGIMNPTAFARVQQGA